MFLAEDKILQHENVHIGREETAVGVFRCADDRLATDIEAGIDDDGATGLFRETFDDFVISAMSLRVDGLHTGRIVHVCDRGHIGTPDLQQPVDALQTLCLACFVAVPAAAGPPPSVHTKRQAAAA